MVTIMAERRTRTTTTEDIIMVRNTMITTTEDIIMMRNMTITTMEDIIMRRNTMVTTTMSTENMVIMVTMRVRLQPKRENMNKLPNSLFGC